MTPLSPILLSSFCGLFSFEWLLPAGLLVDSSWLSFHFNLHQRWAGLCCSCALSSTLIQLFGFNFLYIFTVTLSAWSLEITNENIYVSALSFGKHLGLGSKYYFVNGYNNNDTVEIMVRLWSLHQHWLSVGTRNKQRRCWLWILGKCSLHNSCFCQYFSI